MKKAEGYKEETVKAEDLKPLQDLKQELQKLLDGKNLTDAQRKKLEAAQEKTDKLIALIENGVLKSQDERKAMEGYDEKTVKENDEKALEEAAKRMDDLLSSGKLPTEEEKLLKEARKKAETLLKKIDQVRKAVDSLTKKMDAYALESVKSSDQKDITDLMKAMEELLKGDNLTEDQRRALKKSVARGAELLKRIQDAYDAVHTKDLKEVEGIHKDNVQLHQKTDLKEARDDLKKALETYQGNYTEDELQQIKKDLKRIELAIRSIERAENVIWQIDRLPGTVGENDHGIMKEVLNAKANYDNLSYHERDLVGYPRYDLLMALYGQFDHFRVYPMDSEEEGTITFEVSGPYGRFQELLIDGRKLSKDEFTAKAHKNSSGRDTTVITLSADFVSGLRKVRHTIEVDYLGGIALGTLTDGVIRDGWIPRTGDRFNLPLWGSVMGISVAGLAACAAYVFRKKKVN